MQGEVGGKGMTITNRLMDNLKAGKTSVGCVITMSDLSVSDL